MSASPSLTDAATGRIDVTFLPEVATLFAAGRHMTDAPYLRIALRLSRIGVAALGAVLAAAVMWALGLLSAGADPWSSAAIILWGAVGAMALWYLGAERLWRRRRLLRAIATRGPVRVMTDGEKLTIEADGEWSGCLLTKFSAVERRDEHLILVRPNSVSAALPVAAFETPAAADAFARYVDARIAEGKRDGRTA